MSEKSAPNPLLAEISKAKSPRKGRRLLSWVLFLFFITVCLLLPVSASLHPDQLAKYSLEYPLLNNALHSLTKLALIPEQQLAVIDEQPINKKLINVTANPTQWGHERLNQPTFLGLDKLWNPGHPVDNAHKPWANDCKVCHSAPFVQVQDKDCKSCHRNVGDHVDQKMTTVSALADKSCASCHHDHNGEDALATEAKRYMTENCGSCHNDIKKSFAKTKTENASDFARKHPEFRYQLAMSNDPKDLERTRLIKDVQLLEKTSLKFPHDVHLKAGGIKSPKGKVELDCASCHKLDANGLRFAPVTMKDNCQSCHDLKFEPALSNREVPHGSIDQVLSTLREFYSYVQVNTVPIDQNPLTSPINLVRPGKDEPKVVSFVHGNGDSKNRAALAATSLFEKTSCKVCHDVIRSNEPGKAGTSGQDLPQWSLTTPTPAHAWLAKVQFSHAKHSTAQCTDCHAAEKSKKADEVLMPEIKVCRDCHTGSKSDSNKLVSDCGLCHGFHMAAHGQTQAAAQTAAKAH